MSVYYQDDLVTLYHGDALTDHREWLDADVLVTDPPYGMTYLGFRGRKGEPRRATGPLSVAGDGSPAVRDEAIEAWGERPALVFGRWSIPRPTGTRQVLIWNKEAANGAGMGAMDLPWGPSFEEVYVIGSGFTGRRSGSVLAVKPYTASEATRPNHPTPKPPTLMESLIAKCPPGVVADPFAGSGATLLAARDLGRRAIGVEVEERYCELMANRLQGTPRSLFDVFGETA